MNNSIKRIKKVIGGSSIHPIPRAELWLGTELLQQAGLDDTPDNHVQLVEQLGQDMICLPVADDPSEKPDLGYRYFKHTDLKTVVQSSNRFVAAVVDGPFQELVTQQGLMAVLTGWGRSQNEMVKVFKLIQEKILDLISRCLDQGVHAVVIADDLASDQAPLINPKDIDIYSTPFYEKAVSSIHRAGAHAFFHSCGNLKLLLSLVKKWQFEGLAAVQHNSNDLVGLHQALDSKVVIMAGIEADFLTSKTFDNHMQQEFEYIVNSLTPVGGLILCSGSGLYSGAFLERIKKIYHFADKISAK